MRPINYNGKKLVAKFRTSHSLNIEKGRHNNTIRRQRNCDTCNQSDIEDEFQFILKKSIL